MTREEAASCINTIVILKNLCYRVRGLMDVIDAQNCDKIIEMLNTVGETHKKHTETHACDCVSRQAAIDYFVNGVSFPDEDGHPIEDSDELRKIWTKCFDGMPSAQADLITKIQNGIKATNADDVYSCGMRNGMRWCISLIDGKEPLYENCPSAQPEIIRCKDCKHWDGVDTCDVIDAPVWDNDFCSMAERRSDE